jgi:hypothetical protein
MEITKSAHLNGAQRLFQQFMDAAPIKCRVLLFAAVAFLALIIAYFIVHWIASLLNQARVALDMALLEKRIALSRNQTHRSTLIDIYNSRARDYQSRITLPYPKLITWIVVLAGLAALALAILQLVRPDLPLSGEIVRWYESVESAVMP